MASEVRTYQTRGAAAYDIYYAPQKYTQAEVWQQPHSLPEERVEQRRETTVHARTAIAPFTMAGILTVACMLILVIFGYVQLFEATSRVGDLEYQLQKLNQTQLVLQSRYDGAIDLQQVELRAEELGMALPSAEQTVYVNLSGADRAEIYATEHTSVVGEIVTAMEQSVSGLIAYLRPEAA